MKRMNSLNKMISNTSHERNQTKRMNTLKKMISKTQNYRNKKTKASPPPIYNTFFSTEIPINILKVQNKN